MCAAMTASSRGSWSTARSPPVSRPPTFASPVTGTGSPHRTSAPTYRVVRGRPPSVRHLDQRRRQHHRRDANRAQRDLPVLGRARRGGHGNAITGNRIGTNADGTEGFSGRARHTDRGDPTPTSCRNLISDWAMGIYVSGDENLLEGNRYGTDLTGTARSATPRASSSPAASATRSAGRIRVRAMSCPPTTVRDAAGAGVRRRLARWQRVRGQPDRRRHRGPRSMPNGGGFDGADDGIASPGRRQRHRRHRSRRRQCDRGQLRRRHRHQRPRRGTASSATGSAPTPPERADLGNAESGVDISGSGNDVGDPDRASRPT